MKSPLLESPLVRLDQRGQSPSVHWRNQRVVFALGGSAVTNATTERPLAPASVARSAGANMVDGLPRVVVVTVGAVQFKEFILGGPSRIVVDLAGVRTTMGSKTVAVVAGLVGRVSSVWVVTVLVAAERLERHRRTQLPL